MNLQGISAAFLGDSITFGYSLDSMEDRFDRRLQKLGDLSETFNHGISGTRFARQSDGADGSDLNFCDRAKDISPEAGLIVVFGGVNDYQHGDAPFGALGDDTPDTFCGAVEYLIGFLKDHHPHAQLVFMTPVRMTGCKKASVDARKGEYSDPRPLAEYAQVIMARCHAHGVPVLNLYDDMGLDPDLPEICEKWMPDGIHPNALGHERIAQLLYSFLLNL